MVSSSIGLALDADRCVEILRECGFLRPRGVAFVDLLDIPDDMNEKETEQYLRERGAELCTPRPSAAPARPGAR